MQKKYLVTGLVVAAVIGGGLYFSQGEGGQGMIFKSNFNVGGGSLVPGGGDVAVELISPQSQPDLTVLVEEKPNIVDFLPDVEPTEEVGEQPSIQRIVNVDDFVEDGPELDNTPSLVDLIAKQSEIEYDMRAMYLNGIDERKWVFNQQCVNRVLPNDVSVDVYVNSTIESWNTIRRFVALDLDNNVIMPVDEMTGPDIDELDSAVSTILLNATLLDLELLNETGCITNDLLNTGVRPFASYQRSWLREEVQPWINNLDLYVEAKRMAR